MAKEIPSAPKRKPGLAAGVKPGFAKNLIYQAEYLYGMVYLECYFCGDFRTPIAFDMELHIYEKHRRDLFESLLIKGKGLTLNARLAYVITQMRITGRIHKHFFGPDCLE